MTIHIKPPFIITSRLMPGVVIGDGTDHRGVISIERTDDITQDNRDVYQYYIDLPDGLCYENNDLSSGAGGGSLQSGLKALLTFLDAAADKYRAAMDYDGDMDELFPTHIAEWAYMNSDEIGMMRIMLDEDGYIEEDDE